MGYKVIYTDAFPQGVEVDESLLVAGKEEDLTNALIEHASSKAPLDTEASMMRQEYLRGVSQPFRGLYDLAVENTVGFSDEELAKRSSEEFDSRVRQEQSDASFATNIAGQLATIAVPYRAVSWIKMPNKALETIAQTGVLGAAEGFIAPVYDEFGDSRTMNTAFGLGLGVGLGGVIAAVARKYNVSPEDLKSFYDEADETTKKQIEDDLYSVGQDGLKPAPTISDEIPVTPTKSADVVEGEKELSKLDDPLYREAQDQRYKIEVEEYDAKIKEGISKLEEDVATLPKKGEIKKFEEAVGEHTSYIKNVLQPRVDKIARQIQETKDSKITPKAKRNKLKMLEAERTRAQSEVDARQMLADKREVRLLGDINTLKEARKQLDTYYKTGEIPELVRNQVGERPSLIERPAPDTSYVPQPTAQQPAQVTTTAPTELQPTAGMLNPPTVSPAQVSGSQAVQAPVSPSQPRSPEPSAAPQGTTTPSTGEFKRAGGFDRALGAISTRLRDAFPTVFQGLRDIELQINKLSNIPINKSEPFFKELKRLRPEARNQIKGHLYSGRFDEAKELMNPQMRKAFGVIRQELHNIRQLANAAGMDIQYIENYFPRSVKDLKGLREALGRGPAKGEMDKVLQEYKDKNGVSVIPEEIEVDLINKVVRGIQRRKQVQLGGKGKRTVDDIPEELLQYYDEPAEALTRYFQRMGRDIPINKFMGRHAVRDTEGNLILDGHDGSVGRMIKDMRMQANLSADEEAELLSILSARFIQGEKAMNKFLAGGRDLGYIGTIGNIASAIVNLGDLGTSAALHGFTGTVRSMFGKAAGNKYDIIDMGIDHTIANELRDNKTTAKWLNTVFKVSQFQRLDRLAKNTSMNAAMRKNEALAKTEKGKAKLRQKWGAAYGDEMEVLIRDLENEQVTPRTQLLAFHELSDLQPVSLSEASQYYLENPDFRILYMLKSFTLKQYDIVRREIVREYAKGNKMDAVKKATALLGYMTAANLGVQTVKDFAMGREIEPEAIPNNALWTMLGVYGLNKYVIERYLSQGDVGGALKSYLFPPMALFDSAGKLVVESGKAMEGEEYNLAKASRAFPVIGPIIYSYLGGGAENFNTRQEAELWNKKLKSMGYEVD